MMGLLRPKYFHCQFVKQRLCLQFTFVLHLLLLAPGVHQAGDTKLCLAFLNITKTHRRLKTPEFSSHFSCCDLSTLAVQSSCTRALQCPNIFHQSLWLCNNKGSTFHPAILTRWEPQHWDISTAASPAQSLQYKDTWSVNRWGWDWGYGVDCV